MAINPNLISLIKPQDVPNADAKLSDEFFFFEGNKLKKTPISKIPWLQQVTNITNNNTYELDPSQIVPSEALYNDVPETLAGDILKRVDKQTGIDVNYREIGQLPTFAPDEMFLTIGSRFFERQYEKYVNLEWFNPFKNGITDDKIALQTAVDYLASIGGGFLLIEPGDYAISHVDFFGKQYSNITIEGYGVNIIQKNIGGKVLVNPFPLPTFSRFNASDGIFNFNAKVSDQRDDSNSIKNIKIQGITFISDVVNDEFDELSHQVVLHGVSQFEFTECNFIGFLGDGVAVVGGNSNQGFRNAYNKNVNFYKCNFDGINKDNRQGISFNYCDGFEVDFCNFNNITREGMIGAIDIEPNEALVISQRGLIANCKFKNIGGIGGVVIFQNITSASNISHSGYEIRNNDFEECNANLHVFGTTNYLDYNGNYSVVFENNRCYNSKVPFGLSLGYGVKISNNYFKKITGVNGAIIQDFGQGFGANKILVENNTFEDSIMNSGLNYPGETLKIDHINNTFKDCTSRGIIITSGKGVGKVIGNKFITPKTDIFLAMEILGTNTPLDLINSEVKNNIYGEGVLEINFLTLISGIGNISLDNVPPSKVLYGETEYKVTGGTPPIGFVGDPIFFSKYIKKYILEGYYPMCYQTIYPYSNNEGKTWIRQATNSSLEAWTEWKEI